MATQTEIEGALFANGWSIMYQNTTRPDTTHDHVCVVGDPTNVFLVSGVGTSELDALNAAVVSMRGLDVVLDGAVTAIDALDEA